MSIIDDYALAAHTGRDFRLDSQSVEKEKT